jgi:YegS/Rv2252/BmrU family lipid kinase
VIVNPDAGRGRDLRRATATALDGAGIDHVLRVSPNPAAVADLVGEGVSAGATRFASVGGDGTAHLVLNGIMAHPWLRPPTLGILPAGSGSDFIRTFGLPGDLDGAVAHLGGDETYRCDVGRIEGVFGTRYFLNETSLGITAASVEQSLRLSKRLGKARYTAAFWLALWRFRPASATVHVDRATMRADALAVVIANGQFFGGSLNIAPRSGAGDGLFDVRVFAGPRRRAFAVMPRVARGTHLTHPAVQRRVAADIVVECPPTWPIEADGELIGKGAVTVRVVPGAIDFKI